MAKPKSKERLALKPTAGYVLIEPLEAERRTASGIVLPESHEEKPQRGKVVAVGKALYEDGRERLPECQIGNTVIYKQWSGNEVKLEGKEYLFVKFEDILAVEG